MGGVAVVLASVALLAFLGGGCLNRWEANTVASVQQLWRSPEAYEGRRVRTHGTLRAFAVGTPQEHLALEDARHRVGIRGVTPEQARRFLGTAVDVEGVLRSEEGFGIYVQVEQLGERR